jgi:hypothetical protein
MSELTIEKLAELRAVAGAALPSLLHVSLSSDLHEDVRKFHRELDPPTVLALLDALEHEIKRRSHSSAMTYKRRLQEQQAIVREQGKELAAAKAEIEQLKRNYCPECRS